MMKFKCLVILGLFVSVQSASIYSKPIDIPVEVIYGEEIPYESHYIVPTQNSVARKNLNEKIQLSTTELRQLLKLDDIQQQGNLNSLRNLDAKIQLSPDDLLQADKHLPLPENDEITIDVKSNSVEENSNGNAAAGANEQPGAVLEENSSSVSPVESNKPDETVFASLGESSTNKVSSTEQPLSSTIEENLPDPNVVLLIQLAQNIVSNGLNNIRETITNMGANEEDANKNPQISDEQWDRLNQTISSFFSSLLDRGSLKGNKEYVLQNIVLGVRKVTNNFVENLRSEGANATQPLQPALNVTQPLQPALNATQPQRPGVGQNIINLITAGFQGITSSLQNIRNRSTTASTVLGENDKATTSAPGPFQNIVDQFGQAINQLNPFTSTAAPGSQGDEGSTPANLLQNFANQVGQVINNLNPLNQLSTPAPGSQGPTAAPGTQNEGATPAGPFQAVQDVFSQVGQAVNNIFAGSTAAPGSQNEEGSTPTGPIQQAFQNVVNAIGNLNPLNPSTSAPGSQNEGQTQGPLQGIISQVGQAIGGLNPLNQGSTGAPGNNPLQGIQNVINQVSQAASTFNPLNQGSTASPANNVLEGVQNAINQVGQAASTFNPLNLVPTPAPGSNPIEGIQNAISEAGQILSTRAPISEGNPAGAVVETIQSIGSQVINPENQPTPAEKAKDSFSEQEIMVAID